MIFGQQNLGKALTLFALAMEREFTANAQKGDWKYNVTIDEALADLTYHVAKLVIAMQKGNYQAIAEYCADIANGALIVADLHGEIGASGLGRPILLNEVLGISTNANNDLIFANGGGSGDGPNIKTDLMEIANAFINRVQSWAIITEAMKTAPAIAAVDDTSNDPF